MQRVYIMTNNEIAVFLLFLLGEGKERKSGYWTKKGRGKETVMEYVELANLESLWEWLEFSFVETLWDLWWALPSSCRSTPDM